MTLRRSSAPGRDRSERHRSLPILLLALVAALLVACGGAAPSGSPDGASSTNGTASPDTATSSPDKSSSEPETSDEPVESEEPPESEVPEETPSADPTDGPSSAASDAPTSAPGSADACSGNDENRDFYRSVADAVGWTVYCPVLPKGWFVESGQYRLAGGGRMEIGYRGPGGADIMLRQGAFCDDADGCAPSGADAGPAAFGDMEGKLIAVGDDAWAIVVDPGAKPSWLIEGSGLGQAAFAAIAADLIAVGG
jgi:hypothetical protein